VTSLKLVEVVVSVQAVSRLFGVGTCSPANAGAAVLPGATGFGWSPIRAALAATTVPVAIAAVSIRSWAGEDLRACFDIGGPFRERCGYWFAVCLPERKSAEAGRLE
jgi:hypothetical protein